MTERAPDAGPITEVWFKSGHSGGEGNECVQVAHLRARVGVRDSEDPDGPVLFFATDAWAAFVGGIADGEFGD